MHACIYNKWMLTFPICSYIHVILYQRINMKQFNKKSKQFSFTSIDRC